MRRLADEMLKRLTRVDVLINNVGGYWNTRHATVDGARANIRRQPSRSLPARRSCSSPYSQQQSATTRAMVTGRLSRPFAGPDRLRRPSERAPLLGRTCLQPVQARQRPVQLRTREAAARQWGHVQRCAPRRREHGVRRRGPRQNAAGAVPILRPFMKTAQRGAATSIHVASAPQLQDVTGCYFTNSKPHKSSRQESRPPRSVKAVAGQRRTWLVPRDPASFEVCRGGVHQDRYLHSVPDVELVE